MLQQMWQYEMDKIYTVYGDETRSLWIKNTRPVQIGARLIDIA